MHEKVRAKEGLTSLISVTFLFVISSWLMQPILTLYMREVGATIQEIGLMLAVSSLVETILRIPFGLASERFGKRIIILISLVTQSISVLSLYFVQSPIWFYPVFLLHGIPFAAFWSSATVLASEMAPKGRTGEVMGKYFTAFGLAMFLGPLLCSVFTNFMTYRNIFLLTLIFPLTSTALFLRSGLEKRNIGTPKQYEEREVNVLESYKKIFKSTNVKVLHVTAIFNSVTLSIFGALFSIYAREALFFSPSLIAILFTARGGANALSRAPIGKISDLIGSRKKPLIISHSLQALAFLIISMTGSFPLLILAMVIFGLAWGIRAVLDNTFLTENVDVSERNLALSSRMTMFGFARFLGSIIVGIFSTFLPTTDILKLITLIAIPNIFAFIFFTSDKN